MIFHSKKVQSPIEILMTYSWIILAAMIAAGVLVYFGAFDFDRFFWDRCSIGSPFRCVDYSVVENGGSIDVRLLLLNLDKRPVNVTKITVKSKALASLCNINTTGALPKRIYRGEEKIFIVNSTVGNGSRNCAPSAHISGNRNEYEISINYHYGDYKELTRSLKGELIAPINKPE